MPVTHATLKTKLGALLNDTDENVYSASLKTIAINMALDTIRNYFLQWGGKGVVQSTPVAVVAGTELYAISQNMMQIEKVVVTLDDGQFRQLTPIDFDEAEEYNGVISDNSQHPLYYYRQANEIGFKPKPVRSSTVTIFHSNWEEDLSADGDTLAMPSWVRVPVLFKAASIAASMKADLKAKQAFESDYGEAKQELEYQLHTWQKQRNQGVRQVDLWDTHLIFVE